MSNRTYDQTQFSLEEPLFENVAALPPEPEKPKEEKPKIPWYKQRKLVILAIVGVSILVLLILYIISMMIAASRAPVVSEPEEVIPVEQRSESQLLRRIEITKDELNEADPNQQQLVFPAVDMDVRLDPERRR